MIGLYKGRTKKKGWVRGNLIENFYKKGEYRIGHFGFDAGIRHTKYEVVEPETICQAIPYLFDKNGEEVFTGDILVKEWDEMGSIYFDEENIRYILKISTGKRTGEEIVLDKDIIHKHFRIIGNIHDVELFL